MHYDEETQFNENNVTLYLAEAEEYISNMITYLAAKDDRQDAPIAAIDLDALKVKDYDKGPLSIDNVPNSSSFAQNLEGEDATTEDEVFTNKKDLYKKFEDFVSRGIIDNLSHGKGR